VSALPADQIRYLPMTGADLDAVAATEADLYDFPWTRGNFGDSLAAGYAAWICRMGGALVGYGVLLLVPDEAHLLNISVHRDWQRRGHGQALLEHLEAVARRGDCRFLFLEVRPSNDAGRRLYLRNGYRQIGVRRGYYPARWGREDALVLKKDL
jgi:ribosomal-protein-alanine N-acetyltransferase